MVTSLFYATVLYIHLCGTRGNEKWSHANMGGGGVIMNEMALKK